MNSEQRYFLQVLKDHLTGEKTREKIDIDWTLMSSIARSHQVEGIVYYQCKDFIPAVVRPEFEKPFLASIFYFKNKESSLQEVTGLFDNNGILSFPIKGLGVANCYPIPALRTMGDIDLVVHREDKEKAGELLESIGFQSSVKAPDYDWSYYKKQMHYELHHQLLYDEGVNIAVQVVFFNNCWQYVENGTIDWSFHFLFLLAHLRKHLMNSGAGFRMFMDLAAVIQSKPCLDWNWIEDKLNYLGMRKFSQICFFLIDSWFGVRVPVHCEPQDQLIVDHVTEKIFTNGIFGFNDVNNKQNVAINKVLKHGKARKLSRAQMAIRYLFPKYIHMRYIPYYSFIEGRPWLTPVAWFYRVIRTISGKENGIKHFMKDISIPDEELDLREKELRLWGLID